MENSIDRDIPEALLGRKWSRPDSYGGFSPDLDFVIVVRTRDSSILEESNFNRACKELEAGPYMAEDADHIFNERSDAYVWRAGYWVCGWIEYLMVRRDASQSVLDAAGEIVAALADYPILDEEDYSRREVEAVEELWAGSDIGERIEWCAEAKVSIFTARQDALPSFSVFDVMRDLVQ